MSNLHVRRNRKFHYPTNEDISIEDDQRNKLNYQIKTIVHSNNEGKTRGNAETQ